MYGAGKSYTALALILLALEKTGAWLHKGNLAPPKKVLPPQRKSGIKKGKGNLAGAKKRIYAAPGESGEEIRARALFRTAAKKNQKGARFPLCRASIAR